MRRLFTITPRAVPLPDESPPGANVEDVEPGQIIASEWGNSVAADLSELHNLIETGATVGPPGPPGAEGPAGPAGPEGPAGPAGTGLTDGDKGDVVVASGGESLTFDSTVVSAAARTVLDDATTADMLATLGGQPLDPDLTDLVARWIPASALGPASLDFAEDTDNGTNRIRLTAPAALSSDTSLTLPTTAGGTLTTTLYVDNRIDGLNHKGSCWLATTANITLSGSQTIDGVSTSGVVERVLVKNQTNPAENGIYNCSSSAWTRATDMDSATDLMGSTVYVRAGSTQADTYWGVTAPDVATGFTLGTTAVTIAPVAPRPLNGLVAIWKGTQAQYDAIGTKDPNTLYAITA